MIAIVDTGGANIASVVYAIERIGKKALLTVDPETIQQASHVVLPGVGAAAAAMARIHQLSLAECLRQLTQPTLGICLGMQLLMRSSEEGSCDCLDLMPGKVRLFDGKGIYPVPHMGWNHVSINRPTPLLKGLDSDSCFYFVHSYYAEIGPFTVAQADYGHPFSAIVSRNNFFGVQFHPERSGHAGAKLLRNFLDL